MISPLISSSWGFSFALGCGVSLFGGIQHPTVDGCSAAHCHFGVLTGEDECTSFYSAVFQVRQQPLLLQGSGTSAQWGGHVSSQSFGWGRQARGVVRKACDAPKAGLLSGHRGSLPQRAARRPQLHLSHVTLTPPPRGTGPGQSRPWLGRAWRGCPALNSESACVFNKHHCSTVPGTVLGTS